MGYIAIEVAGLLIAQFLHRAHHHALVLFYLPVLELTLQHLLHQQRFLLLRLFQRQSDLCFCSCCLNDAQPFLFRILR